MDLSMYLKVCAIRAAKIFVLVQKQGFLDRLFITTKSLLMRCIHIVGNHYIGDQITW